MKIDVKHIAKLANLPLKEEEVTTFETQLSAIVGYIEKLNELDTSTVEPTAQVTGLSNVFQKDNEILPSFTQEEALSNARPLTAERSDGERGKNTHNGMFVVEQILEEK